VAPGERLVSESHVRADTRVTCEAFVAALTDFSEHRQRAFPNSDSSFLDVHDRGEAWAEVTEGSKVTGGIWQRLRYDWSTPGQVRLDVQDGNVFGRGGWWLYRFAPNGGGCRIHLTVHRVPNSTKARLLDLVLRFYGWVFHGRDLRHTLRALEAADHPSTT
jgi:hypothetical protein